MGIIEVTNPHGAMLEGMRKAFGSPSDYGHGTAKGLALLALYSFLAARSKHAPVAHDAERRREQ